MQLYYGETGYLELLENIMRHGTKKQERNGITRKLIGQVLEFNLLDAFPLFVSKRIFVRGIISELDMFLNGIADIRFLWARGVHIWDLNWLQFIGKKTKIYGFAWTAEELVTHISPMGRHESAHFVVHDLRGADASQFDLGPIYGVQWRGLGGLRRGFPVTPSHASADQLETLIESLKNGGSRRDILTAFYDDFKAMALPPCPLVYQFHRDGDFIDLTVYQRSADMFLGVPFDVASFAFLLKIVCKLVGETMIARRIVVMFGDAHIYETHLPAVTEQLSRYTATASRYSAQTELPYIQTTFTPVVHGKPCCATPGQLFAHALGRAETLKDNEVYLLYRDELISFIVENYYPFPQIHAELS